MKIPRDCHGAVLARSLRTFGYDVRHQTGSHLRLTTQVGGEHHLTIPQHRPLKIGTLHAILKEVAQHHHRAVEALLNEMKL